VDEQLRGRHDGRQVTQVIKRVGQLVMSIEHNTAMGAGPSSVRLLDGAEEPGHRASISEPQRPGPVTNVPDPRALPPFKIRQRQVRVSPASSTAVASTTNQHGKA
jgi:hypothetical protein